MNDTADTKDIPPLGTPIRTVQEAVNLSLQNGLKQDTLFQFARALKNFEITVRNRLPAQELNNAFSLWWSTAKPLLPADADFDEHRAAFLYTFAKTKAPLGSNSLEEAIRRADAGPPPPQADRYENLGFKRLVAVCHHLQHLQDGSPFFLSVRNAARILGFAKSDRASLDRASRVLNSLVHDEILTLVAKGKSGGKRASRFRFNNGNQNSNAIGVR